MKVSTINLISTFMIYKQMFNLNIVFKLYRLSGARSVVLYFRLRSSYTLHLCIISGALYVFGFFDFRWLGVYTLLTMREYEKDMSEWINRFRCKKSVRFWRDIWAIKFNGFLAAKGNNYLLNCFPFALFFVS